MSLHVLDANIAPLLTSVRVAGLALSLGAQTLIKDFIGGLLILIEDQFSGHGATKEIAKKIGQVFDSWGNKKARSPEQAPR